MFTRTERDAARAIARANQLGALYTMAVARRRFRAEIKHGRSFRAWATSTYNAFACTGKLARIVGRKDGRAA